MSKTKEKEGLYSNPLKVIVVGASGTGKTSIVRRYVNGTFEAKPNATIGVDISTKVVDFDDNKISVQLWDTAGQERFRSTVTSYYRGVHGALVVYSVTSRESLRKAELFLEEVIEQVPNDCVFLLVGNMCEEARVVTEREGQNFADRYPGMNFIEASAKENINVDGMMNTLVREMIKRCEDRSTLEESENHTKENHDSVSLIPAAKVPQSSGCCK